MMNRMLGLFKGKPSEQDVPTQSLDVIIIDGESTRPKSESYTHQVLDFSDVRSRYYTFDPSNNLHIQLPGYDLVRQYYQEQLQTNITFFADYETFQNKAPALLDSFKTRRSYYRHAIIVINDERHTNHTIPYIYLKEQDAEGLLIADSLGVENAEAAKIHAITKLNLYCVKAQRQASNFGCDVDAIIFARDCTRFLKIDQYYIPDLLTQLKSRATLFMTIDDSDLYAVKLPDKLLTTAEISYFVTANREQHSDKVHEFASIDEFREHHYSYDSVLKKNVNKFVEETGWEMANIIEIQFYLNQLQNFLGDKFTVGLRNKFIEDAANLLLAYGSAHEHIDTETKTNEQGVHERATLRPSLQSNLPHLLKSLPQHKNDDSIIKPKMLK